MDLSNELLNIAFGQGAEKISEVKSWRWKKISADSTRFETNTVGAGRVGRNFFNL